MLLIYVEQTNLAARTDWPKPDLENAVATHLSPTEVGITQNPLQANLIVTALQSQRRLSRALAVEPDFFNDQAAASHHRHDDPHSEQRRSCEFVPVDYLLKSIEQEQLLPIEDWAFVPSAGLASRPLDRGSTSDDSAATSSVQAESAASAPRETVTSTTSHVPKATRTIFPSPPQLSQEELQERWRPHKLACFLWCPLVCVNQDLVNELEVMKLGRLIRDGDGIRALAYAHALASVKAFPWRVTKKTDLSKIPNLGGGSIQSRIEEFLEHGEMQDAAAYRCDPKYLEMQRIAKLPGYGPVRAAEAVHCGKRFSDFDDCEKRFVDEFDIKIPRQEVDDIAELVAEYIERVEAGCEYTVLGGYRRGKPQSNDIDILITHRESGKERGLLEKLIALLEQDGIMVERLTTAFPASKADPNQRMMHSSRMDRLDKTFSVFRPPKRGSLQQIHRRVDLLVAPWHYYHTAIVGWTGSTQFERDLRRQANYKSYKFDSSGLTHKVTSKDTPVHSEAHLFDLLDIPYIPPEYRNADA